MPGSRPGSAIAFLSIAFLGPALMETAQAQSVPLGESAQLNYRGTLGATQWVFPREGGAEQSHFSGLIEGDVDLVLAPSNGLPVELRFHPRFSWFHESDDRIPVHLEDFYLDWFTQSFELRAGWQIFSWKTVESVSQADVLNQADREEDFLDPPKLGEPAVRMRLILPLPTEQILEFYYLPYFTPSPLPSSSSRYNLFAGQPVTLLRKHEDIRYLSSRERWRPQVAARWQTRLLELFDASLWYFHGYQRFPGLVAQGMRDSIGNTGNENTGTGSSVTLLVQEYRPIQQGGVTFQGAVGNWLLKGETAWNHPEQEIVSRSGKVVEDWLAYTLGFEYSFYGLLVDNQDLGLIAEAIGDTDWDKNENDLDGFRPFRNHLFAGTRYAFNNVSDRSFLIGGLVDWRKGDVIYRAEYKERVLRSVTLQAELSGLQASGKSQFRPFEKALRLGLGAKYHW